MIGKYIEEVEREYGVKVLYACEAGSRAYGLDNELSDYDVRFIYVHPLSWYLSIDEKRDVIEIPISEQMDMSGWELRKALRLLRKSNPSILEWLHSNQVYYEDQTFMSNLRDLLPKAFQPISVLHHYHKMAKRNLKELGLREEVAIKKYINVIRPIFMCLWILKHNQFPAIQIRSIIDDLVQNSFVKDEIAQLLEVKMKHPEHTHLTRLSYVDTFIEDNMEKIERSLETINTESTEITDDLNDLFRIVVRKEED